MLDWGDGSWQGAIFLGGYGFLVVGKGAWARCGCALQLSVWVQGYSSMGSGPKHESPTRPSKTTR